MKPPLDGVVLITGASSGLGAEFARQLAGRARALVLVARRRDRLEALRAELIAGHPHRVVAVHACDLVDRAATDTMLDAVEREVGPIDVLINNAGFGDYAPFRRASWDKLERMIRLNVMALTYLTHRVIDSMVARGRGGVLNVSSGAGLVFLPGFAAYSATKHYVTGFTEALRLEVKRHGVVVSQVCPGPIDTEFHLVASDRVPPRITLMSAERCVRWTLRAFARGRALIIPGMLPTIGLTLARFTPRVLLRLLVGLVPRFLK